MSSERALRVYFTVLGAIALVAGIWGALAGVDGMAGQQLASRDVDSELRFFAVFWAAFGVAALWVAARVRRQPAVVAALAITLFAAGLARLVSWIDVGQPGSLYLVLLALELGTPPLVLLARRRLT